MQLPVQNQIPCAGSFGCQRIHVALNKHDASILFAALTAWRLHIQATQIAVSPLAHRILWLLCHCEECVCNLAAAVDMSAPAVSHHLRILKKSGIISSRRDGKEVYYSLSDTPQAKLLHHAIDALFEISCPTEQ